MRRKWHVSASAPPKTTDEIFAGREQKSNLHHRNSDIFQYPIYAADPWREDLVFTNPFTPLYALNHECFFMTNAWNNKDTDAALL
ncbi:hypothetical protein FOPE_04161 [Fonsecaea pedrosoi]|nr:hypothetical protein FOPE_04161 [Fonsecaea pedrosoi]